jgi:hypothetical protein
VLVSDQGILMRSEALLDMVLCQMERPNIALVTQTPFCANRPGIGAALEQVKNPIPMQLPQFYQFFNRFILAVPIPAFIWPVTHSVSSAPPE